MKGNEDLHKITMPGQSRLTADLGEAIKHQRTVLGISQEELSRRSGLQRTYISDLERGTRNPSVGSIQKIAHALQIPVAKLFERAGNGDGTSGAGRK
jgi:transcriptional regulator with XRE-family HTH domain